MKNQTFRGWSSQKTGIEGGGAGGGGVTKKGGLGKFADLRGAWQEIGGGGVFEGG